MFMHSGVKTSFDRGTQICKVNRMRLQDMTTNFLSLQSHWQKCPPGCDVDSCPRLEGIPRVPRQLDTPLEVPRQNNDPTAIEFAFPANVPGFNPKCPDCQALIGTAPPDSREYTLFHDDPDGRGHDLCPTSSPFVADSPGLLGEWHLRAKRTANPLDGLAD